MAAYEELRIQKNRVQIMYDNCTEPNEKNRLGSCLRELKLACEDAYRQEIKGEL